ncbi:hypothetical protein TNCV_1687051 [Trichonephila clavipes]|nr:hypothetical protein TNCV_1687051 [Trichonephila clavipes]
MTSINENDSRARVATSNFPTTTTIVSTRNLPPQSIPHIFNGGLDLDNALAIRDVEYPRCLDNPEQRVFDDMLRCRP